MAIAERTANCNWDGDLAQGKGVLTSGSGALGELHVTWASRTERVAGAFRHQQGTGPAPKTSPEELIAAAHASCFAMALSHGLTEGGNPPEHLEVSAMVTLDQVDGAPTVTTSELTVSGRVPGLDAEGFIQAATDAGKNCPVSRALGTVDISVAATLE